MNTDQKEAGLRSLGYAKDGKVYLKGQLGKPDRVIGDVKASEEEAIDYFIRRFELIRSKVDSMLEAMDQAENKGSYLMQVLHLKDSLYTYNAIGDYGSLLSRLEDAESRIRALIETNRVKNLELKKELLEQARVELVNPDLREAIKGVKNVRFSWMTIGSVAREQEDELEGEFAKIMDEFQVLKEKYTEERNVEIEIRKQKLNIILETASRLNTYPPEVEQSYHKMRKLEEEWKAVGSIPKAIYAPLMEEFKRIKKTIAKYARKSGGRGPAGPKPIYIPRFIPPHEQPLYDNLRRRMDLIDEAQGLLRIDLRQANEMAKDIQARWKVAGQIPDKYKSEIFNQFNAISDRIFESSYLARVVHTKFPYFRSMAPLEQVEAKIEAMEEIILKEDMTVKIAQAEFEFMSPEERQTEENRSRFSRLNTSVRKLRMKNKIMYELKKEQEKLRGGGSGGSYQSYSPRERSGGYGQPERGGYSRDSYSSDRRPYGDRPYGDRPSGDRPYNRPTGDRPYGDRPPRDTGYTPRPSEGYNRGGGRDDGYGSRESGGYRPPRDYGNRDSGDRGYRKDSDY
jgi:hypothetical protein